MGLLILLTGFFGAGKTTIAEDACRKIENLQYYTTVTTRPPRSYDTTFPDEYQFVDEETYNSLRSKSRKWDHGEMKGYYYGQDIEEAQEKLNSGKNLLRCVLSDISVIKRIASNFSDRVILIWVDTPLEVANKRLSELSDKLRSERVEDPLQMEENRNSVKPRADYVFQPVGDIEKDTKKFRHFLEEIIERK